MLWSATPGKQPGGNEPLGHPLGFVRAERGWTYQDLVDAVARRVGNMSARREKAWRWEHRGVVPDRATQEALADELGVPHDVVNTLGWPAWLPVGDRSGLTAQWTVAGCLTALDTTAGSALLDRRGFLVSDRGSAAATAAQWLALAPYAAEQAGHGRPPVARWRDDGPCSGVAERLERRLPHLRAMEQALGGGRVRGLADAELRLVTDLMLSQGAGAVARPATRRLYAVAAELARLAGMASLDTGHHAAAERYLIVALSAAHTAGDRLLGANIVRCLSAHHLEAGRGRDALALARAARRGVGADAPARVAAMLALRQATVHAVLGEAAECDFLLAEARAAMSRAEADATGRGGTATDLPEHRAAGREHGRGHGAADGHDGGRVGGRGHDSAAGPGTGRNGRTGRTGRTGEAMTRVRETDAPRAAAGPSRDTGAGRGGTGAAPGGAGYRDRDTLDGPGGPAPADRGRGPAAEASCGPDWAAEYNEAEFHLQTALCHALLRRYPVADRMLTSGLLLHPAERARDHAVYLLHHAQTVLDAGDPERGHRLAEEAAQCSAGVESLRVQRLLGALAQRLRRPYGGASVREETEKADRQRTVESGARDAGVALAAVRGDTRA